MQSHYGQPKYKYLAQFFTRTFQFQWHHNRKYNWKMTRHVAVEAVLRKNFFLPKLKLIFEAFWSLLLLHFCFKISASFPPALWKKLSKNKKKIKLGVPTAGIEPTPLRWETGIQSTRLRGMHKDDCLKAVICLIFQNFKVLAENLQSFYSIHCD